MSSRFAVKFEWMLPFQLSYLLGRKSRRLHPRDTATCDGSFDGGQGSPRSHCAPFFCGMVSCGYEDALESFTWESAATNIVQTL